MPKTAVCMRNGKASLRNQRGFTYLGLLLMMAIAGIGLAAAGITWHNQIRAEKEKELLFVGDQFRKAINSYYQNTPSDIYSYPATLEDLLLDKRYPNVKRHLRKLYPDPITGTTQWGLVKQQGRIIGVYSLSTSHPIKMAGFVGDNRSFKGATSYRKWVFGPDANIAAMLQPTADASNTSPP